MAARPIVTLFLLTIDINTRWFSPPHVTPAIAPCVKDWQQLLATSVVAKCAKYNTDEKWVSTHLVRHQMRGILRTFSNAFVECKCFDSNFPEEVCFHGFIGSGNGFVLHRPAITWTNDGPVHWRIYALSRLNVFSMPQGHNVLYMTDSRFASSQWKTVLLCNDVFHWVGGSLESALLYYRQHRRW